ncbi:tRNA (adenosine(37)-N6)-threonylcarbamoyltransferase complex transferase subunit TsaD [Candidatus Falkowbacteria bacterium]|nr:tRNA (adenosine(37)-N6)-threonylcarbamoyltransferase complex transferase subunit TsaD [Candidatus Falkowbacteria bacterium]
MNILGIETSCDETAASLLEGRGDKIKVISNIVSSQIDIHKKYNGVVPEVAAREHVLNILPVINEAIGNIKPDAIAVATGPGLITSLMVGVETAKTLAYAWNLPVISVNHIEGHIYSCFIDNAAKIKFPAIFLTVSGGHTMIVLMKNHGELKIIGETVDDAAGEAFDKAAKLLGLGYPGGPLVSKEADKFSGGSGLEFPRPMLNKPNFDFSFSGLKTSLLYKVQKDKKWKKRISEYCFKYQEAIVDVLVKKTIKAAKKYDAKTVCLSGGVSANKTLRETLEKEAKKEKKTFIKPEFKYTTDNAAMVACAGYFNAKRNKYIPWQKLKANCNLDLK